MHSFKAGLWLMRDGVSILSPSILISLLELPPVTAITDPGITNLVSVKEIIGGHSRSVTHNSLLHTMGILLQIKYFFRMVILSARLTAKCLTFFVQRHPITEEARYFKTDDYSSAGARDSLALQSCLILSICGLNISRLGLNLNPIP